MLACDAAADAASSWCSRRVMVMVGLLGLDSHRFNAQPES
jgi:hypothetical protein